MKILAIDSSGMPASAAVLEDGTLLAEYTLNFKMTHSQTLVPMLDEIRTMLVMDMESVDAIAVAGGPGSFTGLRIGSAAAKGIGLALNKPLVNVPTLEGMAYNYYGFGGLVVPMIDARNQQVFAGIYSFRHDCGTDGDAVCCKEKESEHEDPLLVLSRQEAVSVSDLCDRLNDLSRQTGKEVMLLGDGALAYAGLITELLKVPYRMAPAHMSQQRAGSVAVRAMELVRQGKLETAAQHRPEYLRQSQAERVRQERLETAAAHSNH